MDRLFGINESNILLLRVHVVVQIVAHLKGAQLWTLQNCLDGLGVPELLEE
jgi:hypothetical protein